MNFLSNLTKAVVATAMTPVDAVVDIATALPRAVDKPHEDLFAGTQKRIKQAGRALDAALEPDRD